MANRRGRARASVARAASAAVSSPDSESVAACEADEEPTAEADGPERPVDSDSVDFSMDVGAAVLGSGDDDAEDSDAPDDVPFVQSKELVEAAARDARDNASRGKRALRTMRRERDAKYKKQKMKKLEAIMSNKLPDEVLQSLVSAMPPAPRVSAAGKSAAAAAAAADSPRHAAGAAAAADDDGDSDAAAAAEPDVGDDAAPAPDSTKFVGGDGFIPLNSDGASSRYRVSVVKDVKSVRDGKAADFMERFRCGGARVQREAFSALASKRDKRRARLS